MIRLADPRRRPRPRRRIVAATALALAALALAGCGSDDMPRLGMPKPATEQGDKILFLWQGAWMAAFVVGGITLILILIPPVLHRRRSGEDLPVQTRYNLPIEILYTIMPLMVIAVLFFYTARDEDRLTQNPAKPDQTVGVIGYRWSWAFNYADEQTYDIGSPQTLPTLWVPVGQTIRFELSSPDVIHSFWVPSFIQKLDVIPGRQNVLTLTPTVEGSYRGKCAELCGVDHARMLFDVQVVSQEEFDAHMDDLRAAGQTGQLETGRVDTSGAGKAGRTEIGGGS